MFRMGGGEWLMIIFVATVFMGPKQVKLLVKRLKETMALLKDEVQDLK